MEWLETKTVTAACSLLGLAEQEASLLPSTSGAVVFEYRGLIYRVATSRGLAAQYLRERRLLEALRGKLPVETPCIEETGAAPVFMAYRKIEGVALDYRRWSQLEPSARARIAEQMGEALAALHDFDPGEKARDAYEESAFENVLPKVRDLLSSGRFDHLFDEEKRRIVIDGIDNARREWARVRESYRDEVFLHNDFSFKNLLVDEEGRRLTSVIDFSSCWTSDRHWDFRLVRREMDPDSFDRLLDAYSARSRGAPEISGEKIDFLMKIALAMDLAYAMRRRIEREESGSAAP